MKAILGLLVVFILIVAVHDGGCTDQATSALPRALSVADH